jgi:hypothetical protein
LRLPAASLAFGSQRPEGNQSISSNRAGFLPARIEARVREKNGTHGISVGESHTFGRKFVDVGRFLISASLTPQIHPAKVVNQKQNDVVTRFVRS